MTFLNSIFLAALAAVAIPLLIHFLSRRRIKIIDFSSLRFLLQMQKSKLRWLKIRDLLLLIIRMMILGLLVMAFARPAITSRKGSTNAPATSILLMDNSPSTEAISSSGIVYDDIKKAALDIIDLQKPGDEISLITLAGKPRLIGRFGDQVQARAAVLSSEPQPGLPAIADGVKLAQDLLKESHNLNRDIFIISDMQDGPQWRQHLEPFSDPRVNLFVINPVSGNGLNYSISAIEFPPQLLAPNEEFQIKAVIKKRHGDENSERLVEFILDDSRRAQAVVSFKSQNIAVAEFSAKLDRPGHHRGYVEIEDDDYSPDNRFYFCLNIPSKIKVLGISEDDVSGKIVSNCLAKSGVGFIDYTEINPGEFAKYNLLDFDVLIINDIASPFFANAGSINNFIKNGGGILIIMGGKFRPESWQGIIYEISALTISQNRPAESNSGLGYYEPVEFDFSHPILNLYGPQNDEGLTIPRLKLWSLRTLSGGKSLIGLADRRTVMAESEKSKVLILGTGLDLKSSDLSLHSFVVPLLIRSVEYLATSQAWRKEYYISGQSSTVSISKPTASMSVSVIGQGTSETVELKRGLYGNFINLTYTGSPGFYSIVDGLDTLEIFAVNHDSLESVSKKVGADQIKQMFGNHVLIESGNIPKMVVQAKFGVEIWKYCLALALLLLITESLLIRESKKGSSPAN